MNYVSYCPFCGSPKVMVFAKKHGGVQVRCMRCGVRTPTEYDDINSEPPFTITAIEKVMLIWNRRTHLNLCATCENGNRCDTVQERYFCTAFNKRINPVAADAECEHFASNGYTLRGVGKFVTDEHTD